MKKVTLEHIAKDLNVSKNTVSKALRGMPGVSEILRKRIIDLARETGYIKSGTQQSGLDERAVNIILICRKSYFNETTFWSQVFYGIWDFSGQNNISIRTITIENTADELSAVAVTSNSVYDGCIIVGSIREELLEKIAEAKKPVVVIDCYSNEVECDYINSANGRGIYKALKYLYDKNHRKIGFINNIEGAYSFTQRYEAFVRYMGHFGLAVDERFVWKDAVYIDTKYYKEKISALRHLAEFPTAWICVNDNTAMAFYNALTELGIRVPEDISIIGFDNIASIYTPFLTTIDVPQKAMGKKAMQQLLLRIQHPEEPCVSIQMNTSLVERDSVRALDNSDS
ncbi:MAG TPA: LacI family transcriptional regulator [Clostridiales bacterium]|nr:LacI family transcriptional regulator [Clostridiales bacterium]